MVKLNIDGDVRLSISENVVELLVGELVVKVKQKDDDYDVEVYHVVMPSNRRRLSF
jgi:hypothetical protein